MADTQVDRQAKLDAWEVQHQRCSSMSRRKLWEEGPLLLLPRPVILDREGMEMDGDGWRVE